jgi:phosphate starvation-inducible protein PhoH and related proteins
MYMPQQESTIQLADNDESSALFGPLDEHVKKIQEHFSAQLVARGNVLRLTGEEEEVRQVNALFSELRRLYREGETIDRRCVARLIREVQSDEVEPFGDPRGTSIQLATRNRRVTPKTKGQHAYSRAISQNDMVFAIGPAGTGKTYLAMASAVAALQRGVVSRIILARPAVEAGESLGFLPGDMYEKVSPYLRPLYDALYDMLDMNQVGRYIQDGVIEIAPLAFMRGRTLNDSFVLLDEAQNTTHEQMKMFLTRLGFRSKAIITGDITQIDLPVDKRSGLVECQAILRHIEGIEFVYLTRNDVVRHSLVQEIIEAYERVEGPDHRRGVRST